MKYGMMLRGTELILTNTGIGRGKLKSAHRPIPFSSCNADFEWPNRAEEVAT